EIQLYGTDGALLQDIKSANGNVHDVVLTNRLPDNGLYTMVVGSSFPFVNDTGDYALSLAQAPGAIVVLPGDDGGPLTNGVSHSGTISLGDIDMWSFTGQAGDNILLRMGAANFSPEIQFYGTDGAL